MLVSALKFLYTPSETLLKYEYYNPKDNTHYLNLNEFNNTNNIDDSIKSLIEILPKLPNWTDDRWKEIGKKLENEVWNSRKIVTDEKSVTADCKIVRPPYDFQFENLIF
ncbi:hypothetical protein RhiirA1_481151 [Rhizophagus irregularis]|uniref:Uncharacterized protein n=1 Tax=Rhizophagus irregularis TaxID=588596 RepID=A0A2I1FJA2_9GLOM|nr:hypothetical protein RhiirA1_481151 [Rhizophagus irregularis]PKY34429.1 hypothetical protein RhiirB3_454125 [Rhizophagus irregularis]UZN99377.1 hypothetical protein OCT59_000654 [Rhizophagus irregularis]GET66714.1 hypothetical protein GLOIN_2v1785590 [Rhizophagus irregularis DAOM 181602=DAOM 197198]CAG8752221.1 16050_t:CDS:2 [Rhizophagus irregularis]